MVPTLEEVLVVPRKVLEERGLLSHGFSAGGVQSCLAIVREYGLFHERSRMEEDPSFKQIIPYAMVRSDDQVFLFRRKPRGGEVRLYGKYSIGVGGHVNPEGVDRGQLVEAGLRRELAEEIAIVGEYQMRAVGLINDDTGAVGRVHLGVVFVVEGSRLSVSVRETDVLEGGLVPLSSVREHLDSMESWSRLVATALLLGPSSERSMRAGHVEA